MTNQKNSKNTKITTDNLHDKTNNSSNHNSNSKNKNKSGLAGQGAVQTPLGARPALGTQPRYEAPGDLRVEIVKTQRLTSVSDAVTLRMAQSWPWGSQIAVKKNLDNTDKISYKNEK